MIELVEKGRVPIKLWTENVGEVEPAAMQQIRNVASLPVVGPHVAITRAAVDRGDEGFFDAFRAGIDAYVVPDGREFLEAVQTGRVSEDQALVGGQAILYATDAKTAAWLRRFVQWLRRDGPASGDVPPPGQYI